MKGIFKIFAVLLSLGALAQTIALAKINSGETSESSKAKGSDGPGI